MDRTGEDPVIHCCHTGSFGAHMAVVVYAVEKSVDAVRFGCQAEKTSHI